MMRNDRHGVKMIVASLAVIVVVIGLIAQREVELRLEQVRVQGIGLVNTLSRIPLERLAPSDRRLGLLQLLKSIQSSRDFAYVAIVDADGQLLEEVSTLDGGAPSVALASEPSAWLVESTVEPPDGGPTLREFSGPILDAGDLVGYVRIGFVEPGLRVVLEAPSFHGAVALFVFLLMPFSYFLLRREMQPLSNASLRLSEFIEQDGSLAPGNESDGAVEDFVRRFERFVAVIDERAEALRRERTELLASSKVLSHQKSRFEALLEALPDAALALDSSGTLTFANGKLESLLGLRAKDVSGQPLAQWCALPEVKSFLARYCGAAGRPQRADRIELAVGPGSDKRIAVSAHPLTDGAGTLVVFRDVTAEVMALRTQAEVLAHMAHELKSPLNVLALTSESLLGPSGADEAVRIECCNVIQDEVERLKNLINTLFSIARIETGNLELERQRVRLGDLLSDVVEMVSRSAASSRLQFQLEVGKTVGSVHADKELLRVALNNLLTNAIKYNHEGGSVTVAAEDDGRELVIRVRDTGLGIPEEDLPRIFDKFYRSEHEGARKRGGHGLGLALVKEIVALHGGQIQVRSTLGEGSEFSLVFQKSSALFREVG